MDIKLAVFDIDETLWNPKKHYVSEETLKAFDILRKHDVKLAVASGRPLNCIDKEIKELDFDYHICVNGAVIYDKDDKQIYDCLIDLALKSRIEEYCTKNKLALSWKYLEWSKLFLSFENSWDLLHEVYGISEELKNKTYSTQDDRMLLPTGGIIKVKCHEEAGKKIINEFKECDFVDTCVGEYFDVGHKNANKGYAINVLMDKLNIKKDNVLCFGDNYNDISMLKQVKYSIAMKNSVEAVKEVAYDICGDVNEDGILPAIIKYIGE